MKSNLLLSNKLKIAGWVIFFIGTLLGITYLVLSSKGQELSLFNVSVFSVYADELFKKNEFFQVITNNILDEIASVFIIVGGLMIMFSKEKNDDEFINSLRLNSLSWAVLINYCILLLSIMFLYGISFLWVMVFNMFTILFIFILRFNWLLRQASKNKYYHY